MNKKIKFYISRSKAVNISQELNKFGLELTVVSYNSYSYEDIQSILNKINKDGFEIYVDFPKIKSNNEKINYEKCGECKFYKEKYGCTNEKSKTRSKNLKTKMSKGCYWGEWN